MSDIVERLRDEYHETGGLAILLLAADEIESLRHKQYHHQGDLREIESLRSLLAEAESLLRLAKSWVGGEPTGLLERINAYLSREQK